MVVRSPTYSPRLPSLNRGLIGWWPMDDRNVVLDYSGNRFNGTNTGTILPAGGMAHPVKGNQRGSIQCGTGNFVTCPSSSVLSPGAVSVFTWLKKRSNPVANYYGVVITQSGGNGYFLYADSTGGIAVYLFAFSLFIDPSTTKFAVGLWTHVGFTYDSADALRLYINGKLDSSVAATTALTAQSAPLVIGTDSNTAGRDLDGFVDDVRVYNRALSAAEVFALSREAFQPQRSTLWTPTNMRAPIAAGGRGLFIVPPSLAVGTGGAFFQDRLAG